MSMSDNTNPCHPGVAEVEETYRLLQDDKLRPYVCDCGRKTNNLKGCCGEIASLEREVEVLKHRARTLWCDSKRDPKTGFVDIKYLDMFEKALGDKK